MQRQDRPDVETGDNDDSTDHIPGTSKPGPEWFTTREEQCDIEKHLKQENKSDRKRECTALLHWLEEEAASHDPTVTKPEAVKLKHKEHIEEMATLKDKWAARHLMMALIQAYRDTNDEPVQTAEAHRLMQSERRISNLKSKLQRLREAAAQQDPEDAEVHLTQMPNEEAFKLNRMPKVTRRDTNPFSEERVNEILTKVTIRADLMEDQKQRVRELVKEFADVFALSLSEVRTVDWFKHKLNINLNVKPP